MHTLLINFRVFFRSFNFRAPHIPFVHEIANKYALPVMLCSVVKLEVQHRPQGCSLEQKNNEGQGQRRKSHTQKKGNEPLEDDYEKQNRNNANEAGVNYDTISFSGSVNNVTVIANMQGDVHQVQQLKRKVNRSRQEFEKLDRMISPEIESNRKVRAIAEDKLKEAEQQIQEIEEKSMKAVSPEEITDETADQVQKLNDKIEVMQRALNEMKACVPQAEQGIRKLEKSKSICKYMH